MHIALAPFRLKAGISEDDLVKTSDAFEEQFVRHQDGIIRRILVKDSSGGYVDVVFFTDAAAIDRVLEAERTSEVCAAVWDGFGEAAFVADAAAGLARPLAAAGPGPSRHCERMTQHMRMHPRRRPAEIYALMCKIGTRTSVQVASPFDVPGPSWSDRGCRLCHRRRQLRDDAASC